MVVAGFSRSRHSFFLHECDVVERRAPELGVLHVCVPGVDVVVHDLAEVGQLREVEVVLDGLLELCPGPVEVGVQDPTGVSTDLRNAQRRDKLIEMTGPALINGLLQPGKGLLTKARCDDDRFSMLLQLEQVAVVADPAMADELLQSQLGKALDTHTGLAAKVLELPHQLGRTAFVVAVELSGTAAAFTDDKRRATF